jgi:archaellum biogenesis protein FlaJ (TadC family)
MTMTAAAAAFGVAWVLGRAAPQEVKNIPLAEGSQEQRLARKLFRILAPVTVMACLVLVLLKVEEGWIMILASLLLAPIGVVSLVAENKVDKKDAEISAFLRSIGGTATSRGTTLKDALAHMKIDSFPTLELDIQRLGRRLKAFVKPVLCWQTFGNETGSKLIAQATGIFFDAVNLGGDPEQAGLLSSLFAMTTTMLRAKRTATAATFTWLIIAMHGILAALMFFLLGIISQFVATIESAMATLEMSEQSMQTLSMEALAFSLPEVSFLEQLTMGMVVLLALINAFAAVSSEGAHLLKIFFYLSILLFLSGVGLLFAPSLAKLVM